MILPRNQIPKKMKMAFSVLRRRVVGFLTSTYKSQSQSRMMSSASPSPSPSPSPLLMQPALLGDGKVAFNFHNLETKAPMSREINDLLLPGKLEGWEVAGSSHGWLAVHNSASRDLSLLNPMTGRLIKLPPVGCGGVSRLALSSSPEDDEDCRAMIISGEGEERRLAVCVPRQSTAWTPVGSGKGYEDVAYSTAHDRFVSMPASYLSELEHTFSGEMDDLEWGSYIIGSASKLEVWDVTEPTRPSLDGRIGYSNDFADLYLYPWPCRSQDDLKIKEKCWRIKYLVVHGGDIFVVVRHVNPRMREDGSICSGFTYISKYRGFELVFPYKTIDFDVYKIDLLGRGDHVYMKCSLEGLAMFVGMNQSFAVGVAAENTKKLEPDSIYFSDERNLMRKSLSDIEGDFGGHDNGIFSYKRNTFRSCCGSGGAACPLDPVDYHDIKRIESPPLWFVV